MTTITREQQKQILIDTANHVISRDNTSPYSENLRELARIALAALESEPVAYIFKHPAGELFWSLTDESNKGQNDVMPVYAAQPVQETGVYKDMLNIIGLLEKNEWAEHCTNTVLGSLLESEITRLVGKELPVPVVPDGWISCSERMPEDEQEVIVHNKLGYRYVSYFDEHSGLFFDMRGGNQMNCIEHILVTHWMPLPAAPEPEQS
ncbi:DUF551 domain-containing protein [Salmonella enterica subsp. enterica serovar Benin]|nr:DUF551 domain-containing protein [Salmonella enterica subsp. enterica serovar Benin]EBW4218916.1 DUF551 domain-containing protein [Salmonella enterica subsp. enterica serovar Benin]ECE9227934.1 DUF551 domain-containing protein [Salmonella enterica subsp. enterica serovar Benin]